MGEPLSFPSPSQKVLAWQEWQGQGQLTTVQLRHVALLHCPRGRVHPGIDYAPSTVQLHRKGRWLVHLESRLLQGPQRMLRLLGGPRVLLSAA